jgi:hypothetical protein
MSPAVRGRKGEHREVNVQNWAVKTFGAFPKICRGGINRSDHVSCRGIRLSIRFRERFAAINVCLPESELFKELSNMRHFIIL